MDSITSLTSTTASPGHGINPFTKRFVAFVDILGFTEIVNGMVSGKNNDFQNIRDALSTIDKQVEGFDEYRRLCAPLPAPRVSLLPPSDVTMTAFSDCYLISEGAEEPDTGEEVPPWRLMAAVQALGADLLAKNILTRGAIVRGDAFHEDRVAFGPAIIEAINIEKDVAKYPRIVVTPEVCEAISCENATMWNEQLLLRDTDGCSFINVLTPPLSKWTVINANPERDLREFLTGVREILLKRIAAVQGLRHETKIRWLIHHFNDAAEWHGLKIEI
jgi:hypothetical protein